MFNDGSETSKPPTMASKLNSHVGGSSSLLSFVSDLNPAKDMWNTNPRIIRKWNQGFKIEMILIDERGGKIQACIKINLIPVFDHQLQGDAVVILKKFGVGENNDPFKVVTHDYKINFYRCTTVTRVDSWEGLEYGFNFIAFKDFLNRAANDLLTLGVCCWYPTLVDFGDLDIYGHPPKQSKRMNFDLQDLEGTVFPCTIWNAYAEQFSNFLSNNNVVNEHLLVVIQHAKVKEWKGKLTVQSDKFGTRMFLNEEIDETNQLRRSLILKQGQASGSTSETILSSQTVYPLHQEFVIATPKKHVDDIIDTEMVLFSYKLLYFLPIIRSLCGQTSV
ncbi:putative nucleic acid-binding protein [Helianthus annuus]|nr:putative nucleic acid-binding protein [Helianthus annuus]